MDRNRARRVAFYSIVFGGEGGADNKTEIMAHDFERSNERSRDGDTLRSVTDGCLAGGGEGRDTLVPGGHCCCVCKRTREKRIHSESRSGG